MYQLHEYLTNSEKPIYNEAINENRTVEDTPVETYFCPIVNIDYNANGFIRIQADNDDTDIEVRLTIEDLETLLKTVKAVKEKLGQLDNPDQGGK